MPGPKVLDFALPLAPSHATPPKPTAMSAPPSPLEQKIDNVGYEWERFKSQFPLTRLLGMGDPEAYSRPRQTDSQGRVLNMGTPPDVDLASGWPMFLDQAARMPGGLAALRNKAFGQQHAAVSGTGYEDVFSYLQKRYPRLMTSLGDVAVHAQLPPHPDLKGARPSGQYTYGTRRVDLTHHPDAYTTQPARTAVHELTHHAQNMFGMTRMGPWKANSRMMNRRLADERSMPYAIKPSEIGARRQEHIYQSDKDNAYLWGDLPQPGPKGKARAQRIKAATSDAEGNTLDMILGAMPMASDAERQALSAYLTNRGTPLQDMIPSAFGDIDPPWVHGLMTTVKTVPPPTTWDWVKGLLPWR